MQPNCIGAPLGRARFLFRSRCTIRLGWVLEGPLPQANQGCAAEGNGITDSKEALLDHVSSLQSALVASSILLEAQVWSAYTESGSSRVSRARITSTQRRGMGGRKADFSDSRRSRRNETNWIRGRTVRRASGESGYAYPRCRSWLSGIARYSRLRVATDGGFSPASPGSWFA